MSNLKATLINTIDQIKLEKLAADPLPGPAISWRIRSVFLDFGVEIDDKLEEALIDIAKFCGYLDMFPKWHRERLSVQSLINICDSQLKRILLIQIANAKP